MVSNRIPYFPMIASILLRQVRSESGLTLRQLAAKAGTSHSTVAAYESGSKTPNVATLDRVIRAAGFEADVSLERRHRADRTVLKGEELAAVLGLAAEFPARHGNLLDCPVFAKAGLQL